MGHRLGTWQKSLFQGDIKGKEKGSEGEVLGSGVFEVKLMCFRLSVHTSIRGIEEPSATRSAGVFRRRAELNAGHSLSTKIQMVNTRVNDGGIRPDENSLLCVSDISVLLQILPPRRVKHTCTLYKHSLLCNMFGFLQSWYRVEAEQQGAFESKAEQNDIWTAVSAGFISPENLDDLFQSVPTVAIALARRQALHVPKTGLAVSQSFYPTLLIPKICSKLISSFILLQFAQLWVKAWEVFWDFV